MPRFELDRGAVHALAEYLRRLDAAGGGDWVIGTWAEPEAAPAAADALRHSLQGCFDSTPLFGRRLRLEVLARPAGLSLAAWAEQLEGRSDLLALAAPLDAGREAEVDSAFSSLSLPVVGPVDLLNPSAEQGGAPIFRLAGGLEDEVEVLAGHLAGLTAKDGTLWLVRTADSLGETLEGHARRGAERYGAPLRVVRWNGEPNGSPLPISPRPGDAVLVAVPRARFAQTAADAWQRVAVGAPALYLATVVGVSGSAIGWATYPWIGGQGGEGALHARWGWVSCGLLVEALRRAGAGVTRQGLVAALESIADYRASQGPALHFGPGRHVGANGAYLVRLGTDGPAVWVDLGSGR
jgi:hypothetical protein